MPIAHTHLEPQYTSERSSERHQRPGLALWVRVRWQRLALDSALAAGADPATSPDLALRARQLAAPKARESLADSIERLLDLAARGSAAQFASIRVPFSREQVEATRPRLTGLIEALRTERRQPVQGLARASLLVEGGRGPLYVHDSPHGLERAVEATLSKLVR